ncbi:Receptor-like serine/threonine-protein kinase SD1-7 [Glycine soja]|uniref:Receptor-like serine/threonine-protein kinase SD1-7 n=1 Tax=Glycine soja TaxID=3848 RepID=A0A0B2QIT0_GLYSO|nr:Receptor-like serine/threonine-protein kinase SD1-7 [Glycine soja]
MLEDRISIIGSHVTLTSESSTGKSIQHPTRDKNRAWTYWKLASKDLHSGFFNLANSNNRYLGVWYKNIFPRTTVWVANKETPLKDNTGILEVGTNQGILSIKDGGGAKIWSSSASHTPNKSIVVKLLESGNMVVKDGHNNLLWQSFDYPSDTLLPGMKIGVNFKTGQHRALRSWKSLSDLTLVAMEVAACIGFMTLLTSGHSQRVDKIFICEWL